MLYITDLLYIDAIRAGYGESIMYLYTTEIILQRLWNSDNIFIIWVVFCWAVIFRLVPCRPLVAGWCTVLMVLKWTYMNTAAVKHKLCGFTQTLYTLCRSSVFQSCSCCFSRRKVCVPSSRCLFAGLCVAVAEQQLSASVCQHANSELAAGLAQGLFVI